MPDTHLPNTNLLEPVWKELFKDICNQRYILVLGNENMLETQYCDGDIEGYFKEQHFNYLYNRKLFSDKYPLWKFIVEHPLETNTFSCKLRKMLETKLFKTVITTCVDDTLERVLREIWGDELIVRDFKDPNNNNLRAEDIRKNEFNEIPPTLFYAFGKAGYGKSFVLNDDDKLVTVAEWLNKAGNGYPTVMTNYISEKQLLAIGCKFDDWLFRFFWFSLRNNVHAISNNYRQDDLRNYGKVVVELPDNDKLKEYLKDKGWYFGINATDFIDTFLSKYNFEADSVFSEIINRTRGGCFISYASEDFNFAMYLYLFLTKNGINVWLDNEKLFPGDPYDKRIYDAINECRIFMPILSRQTETDYNNGEYSKSKEEKRYYLREWDIAFERKQVGNISKPIDFIPVCTRDFDVRSQAYRDTPWHMHHSDITVYKDGERMKDGKSLLHLLEAVKVKINNSETI